MDGDRLGPTFHLHLCNANGIHNQNEEHMYDMDNIDTDAIVGDAS
jgi:hypothetical protein